VRDTSNNLINESDSEVESNKDTEITENSETIEEISCLQQSRAIVSRKFISDIYRLLFSDFMFLI